VKTLFFKFRATLWLLDQIWYVHVRKNPEKDTGQLPSLQFTLFFLPFSFPFPISCLVSKKQNIDFHKLLPVILSHLCTTEHPVRWKRSASLSPLQTQATKWLHKTVPLWSMIREVFKRRGGCARGNSREGASPYGPV